jgi:hypothetical protein
MSKSTKEWKEKLKPLLSLIWFNHQNFNLVLLIYNNLSKLVNVRELILDHCLWEFDTHILLDKFMHWWPKLNIFRVFISMKIRQAQIKIEQKKLPNNKQNGHIVLCDRFSRLSPPWKRNWTMNCGRRTRRSL